MPVTTKPALRSVFDSSGGGFVVSPLPFPGEPPPPFRSPAVGVAAVPEYARLVRGSVLSARENQYVEAARVVGCSDRVIMLRHVLPNVFAPLLVVATLGIAWAILAAASLSFLGMGAQPPTPEWGAMLSDGRNFLRRAWWIVTFPGLAIMFTVLIINVVGDALRDALDPRITD